MQLGTDFPSSGVPLESTVKTKSFLFWWYFASCMLTVLINQHSYPFQFSFLPIFFARIKLFSCLKNLYFHSGVFEGKSSEFSVKWDGGDGGGGGGHSIIICSWSGEGGGGDVIGINAFLFRCGFENRVGWFAKTFKCERDMRSGK